MLCFATGDARSRQFQLDLQFIQQTSRFSAFRSRHSASKMTIRNLNRTGATDTPFVVHYLIWAFQWRRRDIFIVIFYKIDLTTFDRSVHTFFKACLMAPEPSYEDENTTVQPRKRRKEDADGEEDTRAPSMPKVPQGT